MLSSQQMYIALLETGEIMIQPNDIFTLSITDTNSEGVGLCRQDGMVIFVPRTVTGDLIRLEIESVQKNYALGRCLEIITPSPHRKNPDCPYFEQCGGCTLQHVSREEELTIKENGVRQALRRMRIEAPVAPLLPTTPTEYRNKAVFHLSSAGLCGYFARETHKILSSSYRCLLLSETFRKIAAFTEEYIQNTPTFSALPLQSLYLRRSQKDENIAVILTDCSLTPTIQSVLEQYADALTKHFSGQVIGVLHGNTPKKKYALPQYTVLRGERYLYDSILDLQIRLSPEGFYQVNPEGARLLAQTVLHAAEQCHFTTAADLYCGSGFFALLLARRFPERQIFGIEINPDSIRDAEINRDLNGLANVRFFCGDAADFTKKTGAKPELITVDPPRAGCSDRMCQQIAELSPQAVIYVSCNPLTLARDLVRLKEAGYTVSFLQPVNMFPRTEHCETVCLLSKLDT